MAQANYTTLKSKKIAVLHLLPIKLFWRMKLASKSIGTSQNRTNPELFYKNKLNEVPMAPDGV